MKKLILAEALCGQTRLAVLEDGLLAEIYSESAEGERCVGNIYAGRVENVLPGMQAAFVNIGLEKNAYLSVADIPVDKSDLGIDEKDVLRNASIKTLLRPGQEILVQGIKEPGGTKGARISCHITLPGRYCVLMPTVDCVGVSRKITQAEERARLHDLADALRPQGMGIIVRTAAEHVEEAKLRDDIAAMLRLWETIQNRQRYGVALRYCTAIYPSFTKQFAICSLARMWKCSLRMRRNTVRRGKLPACFSRMRKPRAFLRRKRTAF